MLASGTVSRAFTVLSWAVTAAVIVLVALFAWAPSDSAARRQIVVSLPLSRARTRENIDQFIATVRALRDMRADDTEVVGVEPDLLSKAPPAGSLPFNLDRVALIVGPPDSSDALALRDAPPEAVVHRIAAGAPVLFASATNTTLKEGRMSDQRFMYVAIEDDEKLAEVMAEHVRQLNLPFLYICASADSTYAQDLRNHVLSLLDVAIASARDLIVENMTCVVLDGRGGMASSGQRTLTPLDEDVGEHEACTRVLIGTTAWFTQLSQGQFRCKKSSVILSDGVTSGTVLERLMHEGVDEEVWGVRPKIESPSRTGADPSWYWGHVVYRFIKNSLKYEGIDRDAARNLQKVTFEVAYMGTK